MKKLFLIGAIVIAMLIVSGLQGNAYAGGKKTNTSTIDGCDACYKKNNGQLRLVSGTNKCLTSEKYIDLCKVYSSTYQASDYFPTGIGNTWVYNLGTVTVLDETHTFSGGTGRRIENFSLVCMPYDIFVAQSVDGLTAYGLYDRDKDVYLNFSDILPNGPSGFPFPTMRIGDSWGYSTNSFTLTYNFVGLETITVPAGTFYDCLKIKADVIDTDNNPGSYTTYFWYAKNVGLIKVERTNEAPIGHSGCLAVTSGNPLAVLESALINGISYP